MNSLRRWLYRPKRSDSSLLAQFYFADEDLNQVAAELDSFEGRKDPERCTSLVNQLRACQARVLNVVSQMMDEQVKDFRASRDFRVKFPDDVIQENLAGQLWFGAECLAAGSSIMNREVESACMRPLARALTKNLDSLRNILREQCLRNVHEYTDLIKESLIIFDKLFAEFELSYVSAMVPVKTAHEYDLVQEITVLFSETVQRAVKIGLLTRDMIDEYDPALMFTIPRLAIVSGVHIFKDGPLNPDNDPWNISEMFRPFQTLLLKIRELLGTLTDEELNTLERALCSQEEPSFLVSLSEKKRQNSREERRRSREERKLKSVTDKRRNEKEESDDGSLENELTALEIAERLEALALNFVTSRNAKLNQFNEQSDQELLNKSSETSSTSSSSFYSEVETEDKTSVDAEKVPESDHADEAQLKHFTNHLYHEANLDSHNMTQDNSSVDHQSALPAELTGQSVQESTQENGAKGTTASSEQTVASGHSDVAPQRHNLVDVGLECAVAGRAHFAMNKCDSDDSGLHSEVLSNSDSIFTISSSDSAQHVAVAGTSECIFDHRKPGFSYDQAASNYTISEHTLRQCNGDDSLTESKDSSENVISLSEVRNCTTQSCLHSPSGCEEVGASSDVAVLLTNKLQEGHVSIAKSLSLSDGTILNTAAHHAASEMCCGNIILDTADFILTRSSETGGDSLTHASGAEGAISKNHSPHFNNLEQNSCTHSKLNGCGNNAEATVQIRTAEPSFGHNVRSIKSSEELTEADSSETVVETTEHSKSSSSVKENVYDVDVSKQDDVCVNLPAGSMAIVREAASDVNEMQFAAVSDVIPSESFHTHSTVPSAATQDKENNNEVKSCAVIQHDLNIKTSVPTDVLERNGTDNTLQLQELENITGSVSEPTSRYPHSPHILIINIEPSVSTTVETSESSQLLNTTTNITKDSRGVSSSPANSQNRLHVSTSTTTMSNSSSGPDIPSKTACNNNVKGSSKPKSIKKSSRLRRQQPETSSNHAQKSGLPSQAKALIESQLLDSECNHSSETSSYNSDCGDQEEIDLAIRAAENATRQQIRARFQSSSDMIHRLFVCISGVADQLQTNFAGDLRNILRAVFDMNCSEPVDISTDDKCKETTPLEAAYRAMSNASRTARRTRNSSHQRLEPPLWIPDEQTTECMSCQVPFTFVRRRHHCRNCGKIFCSRCSSNFVPLPHFGQEKAVRVCNRCYMFHVTPFTARPTASSQ